MRLTQHSTSWESMSKTRKSSSFPKLGLACSASAEQKRGSALECDLPRLGQSDPSASAAVRDAGSALRGEEETAAPAPSGRAVSQLPSQHRNQTPSAAQPEAQQHRRRRLAPGHGGEAVEDGSRRAVGRQEEVGPVRRIQ